ncbi:hypothetical protein DNTS_015274 [Danionella cerebrum]|uniref:Myb/SANT-like DNA-binding domain-containing protein n=1 Tax=Danionella cerebrum TaxID=2873325 RepID=A0A553MSJ1_9TELE|nr:hypothetical protein DNTS_015274 [Danionella translucida]
MDSSSTSSKIIYRMSDENIAKLIQLRSSHSALFDGRKNSSKTAWSAILREMGLEDMLTTEQAAKKWENLKTRYKDAKYPPSGIEKNPTCWRWFNLMDVALGKEFDEKVTQQVFMTETDTSTPSNKKLRQIRVKGEILEYLEEEEPLVNVLSSSRDLQPNVVREHPKQVLAGNRLGTMRTKLHRQRQCLEKELGGLQREKALLQRERALVARERAALQRDRAQLEKDRAAVIRDKARMEQERLWLKKDREAFVRERAALERDRKLGRFTNIVKGGVGCNGVACPHGKNRERLMFLLERVMEKL